MSKLNIIQRRELEPLMLKANRIIKHYEKAANCYAFVLSPDSAIEIENFDSVCSRCNVKNCTAAHQEAMNKARTLGSSYIYLCQKGLVFWTCPFYSGERFAGALFSGGVKKSEKNTSQLKSLAQILLICAKQISGMSFFQKNVVSLSGELNPASVYGKNINEKQNNINYTNRFSYPEGVKTESFKTSGSPLDMERSLFASLRRGDNEEGHKILTKLLKILYREFENNFPAFRLKAIELAVLLSRAAADPRHIKDNTSLETTKRYLKMIEDSTNFNEISEILSSITDRMSGMIFSFHGVRHFSALRKAERYIWKHYTRKLSLKEIANASGLSAPYFSTVFKEEMGENLSNYLNRLRIEKAAAMLVTTNMPISEIARICGFEDQSWFSKIFKNNTNLTPGKYRELGIFAVNNTENLPHKPEENAV